MVNDLKHFAKDVAKFYFDQIWSPVERTIWIFFISLGVEAVNLALSYYSKQPILNPERFITATKIFDILGLFAWVGLAVSASTLLAKLVKLFIKFIVNSIKNAFSS